VKRHEDNLKMEGKFEGKQLEAVAIRGERMAIKKHQDNLTLEGELQVSVSLQLHFLILRCCCCGEVS